MQLVKDDAVGIEAVLVRHVSGKHLVGTVGGQIGDLLLRFQYLHPLTERWGEPHHVHRHVKDDLRLVAVGGAAVHLGPLLSVTAQKQKRHGSSKL